MDLVFTRPDGTSRRIPITPEMREIRIFINKDEDAQLVGHNPELPLFRLFHFYPKIGYAK